MKSKIEIVGAKVLGKLRGTVVYEVMHSTRMEITMDRVPFDRGGRIALDPGRGDDRDTYTGTPQEDGGDKKKGTVHITDAAFRDFQGNDIYPATVTAYVFNPADNEDFQEVGMVFVMVRDLIPE